MPSCVGYQDLVSIILDSLKSHCTILEIDSQSLDTEEDSLFDYWIVAISSILSRYMTKTAAM